MNELMPSEKSFDQCRQIESIDDDHNQSSNESNTIIVHCISSIFAKKAIGVAEILLPYSNICQIDYIDFDQVLIQ